MGGVYEVAVVGSGAMIYLPSFVKITLGIRKLIEGIHTKKTW
jgi:hypothetical protein